MAEEIKMVTCKFNLRPRLAGNKLIEAGTPFPENYVVGAARKTWLEQGNLVYVNVEAPAVKEAPEAPAVKTTPKAQTPKETAKEVRIRLVAEIKDRFNTVVTSKQFTKKGALQAEYDRLKKAHAPTGFFTKTAEELADFNLDELDALHAQICSENDLDTPDLFESEEQAIAKLTGAEG